MLSLSAMPRSRIIIIRLLVIFGACLFTVNASGIPGRHNPLPGQAAAQGLTKRQMELIFQEMIPPQQQAEMASNPETKKKFVDEIKKLLSVAAVAESEGYAQRPDVQAELALQDDMSLNESYRKKHPDLNIGDDEINAYYQAHPAEFDTFLQNNPRFQQLATAPNRDLIKKEFGKLKVIAGHARKEKLDEDEIYRVKALIQHSQVLNNAYLLDLDKNGDRLVGDADVETYYKAHAEEFEKVRARHILISKEPPSPEAPKKGTPSKAPSKLAALRKARIVLARARRGENFVALVKRYSDDPGSKDKGGEYTFARGEMVLEFEKAAFALRPGQISGIVETPFGYHIIKLEERQGGAGAADPQVHRQIVGRLKQDRINARVEEIARNSKVVVPEEFDMTVKAPVKQ